MRRARFRVLARLDGTRPSEGTVTIERTADIFAVRPLRRRRTCMADDLGSVFELMPTAVDEAD